MPAKPVYLRTTIMALPLVNAAVPASLSGAATITGTMREGQTINFTWPTIANGIPSASAVLEYTVLTTTNAGATYSTYSQGTTPPATAVLVTADVGKQFLLRTRVYNAATFVDEVPQIISSLSSVVSAIALIAPTFASGPTVTGTPANGQVMTVAFTTSGSPTITSSIRWLINAGIVVGQTSTTWTGLGLSGGDQVKAQVQLTGPGGTTAWVDSNVLLVASGTISQAASFGASTAAGTGGWRPQLASGAVESLASYNSLTSGSLGVYTPSIASGRLVFSGGSGAPNGAVLRCTGASGRVYDVTITQVANRRDFATDADMVANKTIAANLGLTLSVRQNAQISSRDRLVTGTDFLSGGSQAQMDSSFTQPIALVGEGPHIAGEYHMQAFRAFAPSSFSIKSILWADQKTIGWSVLIETSSSRKNQNISIEDCSFSILYEVDVVGDWSTGFGSTGFAKNRMVYFSGGWTKNVKILNNRFIGGYMHAEISYNGFLEYSGNHEESAYFDYRKTSAPSNYGANNVRLESGNLRSKPLLFSANETSATAPHSDMDQVVVGGPGTLVTYYDADIAWAVNDVEIQTRFHSDRTTVQTGGHRWSDAGSMFACYTAHTLTNDYPDNLSLNRVLVLPAPFAPMPMGSSANELAMGTSKPNDGGSIGTHKIDNSSFSGWRQNVRPGGIVPVFTGFVDQSSWVASDFNAAVDRWADWGSLPVAPTYNEALSYFKPKAGGALVGVSPWAEITTGAKMSDTTISTAVRPVPTLSALTVTDTVSAAFTVTTDIATNSTIFWAVFAAQVTAPDAIRLGLNGSTSAIATGINHRGNSAGSIVGGGTESLAAGTYWLCVAQYNGSKRTGVATVQFTVP
jgi:hypothetical protein